MPASDTGEAAVSRLDAALMNLEQPMTDRGRNHRTERAFRRRGNVLVLVISMLVMLFVFGSTFLLTARFNRLAAEDQVAASGGSSNPGASNRVATRLADLLAADIGRQLREDLVGTDGIPFNGEGELNGGSVVEDYGDGPGMDGLLSSLEPYFINGDPLYGARWHQLSKPYDDPARFFSNGAQDNQNIPSLVNITDIIDIYINADLENPLLIPPMRTMQTEWQQMVGRTTPSVSDAEGDGMPSSLGLTSFNRGDDPFTIADEQLLIDEDSAATATFGTRYVAAVRAFPNNAMVTLYRDSVAGQYAETAKSLIDAVRQSTDPDLDTFVKPTLSNPTPTQGPIQPDVEEPALRNRFFLPRNIDTANPASSLIEPTLLERRWSQTLMPDYLRLPANSGPYRYWPIEYNAANVAGFAGPPPEQDNEIWWASRLDPFGMNYDRRHLITTMGSDDEYRRAKSSGANSEQDSVILSHPPGFGSTPITLGVTLAEYPANVAANAVTRGRVKFSLRSLVDVGTRLPGDKDFNKGQQLIELYAFYRALLTQVDTSDNDYVTPAKRNALAAALAINTWDYFDSDTEPTDSNDIINGAGFNDERYDFGTQKYVLGVEGQPFITEIYIGNIDPPADASFNDFAFELFNPWPYAITLRAADWGFSSGTLPVFPLAEDITIPAANTPGMVNSSGTRNLAVIANQTPTAPPAISGISGQDILGDPNVKTALSSGTVALYRNVHGVWRKVDQIKITTATGATKIDNVSDWLPGNPDTVPSYSESLQRDLHREGVGITPKWRFCVGAEDQVNGHTLGLENSVNITRVAGVPLFFVDPTKYGGLADPKIAFPTTGCLLLVNSMGHEGTIDSGETPFSEKLVENEERMVKLDNGHLPIFDQDNNAQSNVRADVNSDTMYDGKDVPWGQLVFDYFTALPLDGTVDPDLPLVEKVTDPNGNTVYGPRVKGRININAAPWTVMDGIPVLNGTYVGGELPIPQLETDVMAPTTSLPITGGWFETLNSEWSISPDFALLIQSYREKRDVYGQGTQTTSSIWPLNPGDLRPQSVREGTEYNAPIYGLVSVGELANAVLTVGGGWTPPDYISGVAPLVRMKDWATVKSNVFTVYATVVDVDNSEGTARMQLTIDRTRCLYTDEQPAVVVRTVLKQ